MVSSRCPQQPQVHSLRVEGILERDNVQNSPLNYPHYNLSRLITVVALQEVLASQVKDTCARYVIRFRVWAFVRSWTLGSCKVCATPSAPTPA